MISILIPCHSRQEHLDQTLPKLLAQEDVDFEIVIAAGPTIRVPEDTRIRTIPTDDPFLWVPMNNKLFAAARGELFLITQADILANNPKQIKILLDQYRPGTTVSTKTIFTDGRNDPGLFMSFRLIAKKDVEKIGGFHTGYTGLYGYEDDDFMSSLIKNGIKLVISSSPNDYGVHHIPHQRGHPTGNTNELLKKSHDVYYSRHSMSYQQLYQMQVNGEI